MREDFLPYGLHLIDEEDIHEVVKVLRSDWIVMGNKVKEFEKHICRYTGSKYGVAVNSGTSALDIAVSCLNVPKGSEIITTPFTFVATSNAILYNDLRPVFADIQKDTYNIDPETVRKKVTDETKAIMYMDYAGHPCDIDEIKEIADEHGLYLIEDACHSLGAAYKGKRIGGIADVTAFSFHPVKHMTTGEGGMAVTNDEKLARKMDMLRNHGIDKNVQKRFGSTGGWEYDMKILGKNYRITDFQAALGISQLKKLDSFIKRREEIADIYQEMFSPEKSLQTPTVRDYVKTSWHLYSILLDKNIDRDAFFRKMRSENIGVNVHFIPIYHHTYYAENFKIDSENFPVTEDAFKREITLPLHQRMTDDDVIYVIETAKNILKGL